MKNRTFSIFTALAVVSLGVVLTPKALLLYQIAGAGNVFTSSGQAGADWSARFRGEMSAADLRTAEAAVRYLLEPDPVLPTNAMIVSNGISNGVAGRRFQSNSVSS